MQVLERRSADPGPPEVVDTVDAEALIREARRRRRKRWMIGISLVLVVAAGALIAVGVASSGRRSGSPRTIVRQPSRPGVLPTGRSATLTLAGSLAVGPSGILYVATPDGHRILARLPDGAFRVVAGAGTAGYSGNGGRATRAELADPTDLTFDASGDLYFVDSGRVRVVRTDGVIETVAGDGSTSWPSGSRLPPAVADRTAALGASFHSNPSIAFGPHEVLYIATETQLLRLTRRGRLEVVETHLRAGARKLGLPRSLDGGLGPIAVAGDGSLYVSGFNGWEIWHVAKNGTAAEVGYDRENGGAPAVLETGPTGAVYSEDGEVIARVTPKGLIPVNTVDNVDGEYFWAMDFALGPHGALYVDELPGGVGFEPLQELVSVRGGAAAVLWQETRSTAARRPTENW